MARRWTDEDIRRLTSMAGKYPIPAIAEAMDRSVGGVTFKAHQIQLPLRLRPHGDMQGVDPGPAGFDWTKRP